MTEGAVTEEMVRAAIGKYIAVQHYTGFKDTMRAALEAAEAARGARVGVTREEVAKALRQIWYGTKYPDEWRLMADYALSLHAGGARVEREGVHVRIAVSLDADGSWSADGWHEWDDKHAMKTSREYLNDPIAGYFITAVVPLPQPSEIAGVVERGE